MTGNPRVSGANRPSEASVLSATYSTPQATRLTGNCSISADVGVCNPDGQIQKKGNVVIAGDEIFGAPEPDWPEVDVGAFSWCVSQGPMRSEPQDVERSRGRKNRAYSRRAAHPSAGSAWPVSFGRKTAVHVTH